MNATEPNAVPFNGFDLMHSTSFSQENDEKEAIAAAEDAEFQKVPISLQQKHIAADYDQVHLNMMREKGHHPLERKPFVFQQGNKTLSKDDHIREIKQKSDQSGF
ncbi:MAG: hypothetical protein FJ390_06900 [Verrucomicrobia bacterium]|nr:hypothetical protein [Verrucomicrobiota bacterium]